jgi:hypothetical protein
MTSDPIVDEVRAARDAFAKEHDYDLARIFEALREIAREDGGARVTLPPRRVQAPAAGPPAQPTAAAEASGTYGPGSRR